LSYSEAAEALGMGKASVQRAYDELQAKGFIVLMEQGNWYHRKAHEWRLITKPVQEAKAKSGATNDWYRWQSPKTKRGSKSEPSQSSVVPFQNPTGGLGSELEPVRAKK
jgi:DNA-binding transcriptional MocR family regulator